MHNTKVIFVQSRLKWSWEKYSVGKIYFSCVHSLNRTILWKILLIIEILENIDCAYNIYFIFKYYLSILLFYVRYSLFQLNSHMGLIIHLLNKKFNKVYNKLVPTDNINYIFYLLMIIRMVSWPILLSALLFIIYQLDSWFTIWCWFFPDFLC